MMGALIGAGQLPLDMDDLEAELNLQALKKGIDAIAAAT